MWSRDDNAGPIEDNIKNDVGRQSFKQRQNMVQYTAHLALCRSTSDDRPIEEG